MREFELVPFLIGAKTPRCQATVIDFSTTFGRAHQCRRAAKEGDKCWQHSEDHLQAKQRARLSKFDRMQKDSRIRGSAYMFLDALTEIANGCPDPQKVARRAIKCAQ